MDAGSPPPAFAPCERFEPLATERLVLRVVQAGDVDAVAAYQSLPEVCRWVPFGPRDRAELAPLLAERARRVALRGDGDALHVSVVRRADGEVLGELYLAVESVERSCVEVGWMLHPDHAGAGYATEAARALLAFAFGTLRAHCAVAHLHPGNDASVRLCERLGMRREGLHRETLWVRGAWQDSLVYALLAREWAAGADAAR